ncbi:hypothetical protein [Nonomuraea indica]|uniref:Uncharacterized protein n=1 Tax=Nonomuraea indica TaxID=1581193 RepID=A0ABW8AGD3_9ACTN
MDALKLAATSAPGLTTGILVASTAIANVPAMGDARANWLAIAKDLEAGYPRILDNATFLSRAEWIGDDREAYLHATAIFSRDVQKLSGLCFDIEGEIRKVRDAYVTYWWEIGGLAAMVVGYVLAARLMRLTPHTGAYAELLLNRLVAITNFIIAKQTKLLGAFLLLSGTTLSTISKSMMGMFNVKPTGAAKIDFKQAVISTRPPTVYVAVKREKPEPHKAP